MVQFFREAGEVEAKGRRARGVGVREAFRFRISRWSFLRFMWIDKMKDSQSK